MITIEQLKRLKESEDHVEFKKGEGGNIAYNGGNKTDPSDRRRCILGYVTALCNEGGGLFVIGMHDKYPHKVVGTKQCEGEMGDMEARIYRDTGIRTRVYELFEETRRVLVIEIPCRPSGKVYKFEDVTLMRVGEELKPMSDEVYLRILQEQEPDFSQQICEGLCLADLDEEALSVLKEKYAIKQNNPRFRTLSTAQILTDLDLSIKGKLTNAALVLLGKETAIRKHLPQNAVMLEYRNTESQIHFDNRYSFIKPFFLLIDELWKMINLRNGSVPIQDGAYIFNIPDFNEAVIREAVNNAITHRDYRRNSEVVVKQYPKRMDIVNPGSFPQGVTLQNLLTVPSTPRNRLLADVLQKTGIVERSGQGIDKIYYNTLSEGKKLPDYSKSDGFNVYLSISAIIEDQAFALFIESVQSSLPDDKKLSVFEVLTLDQIKRGVNKKELDKQTLQLLLQRKLIEKKGQTNGVYYLLSKEYYIFTNQQATYEKLTNWDEEQAFNVIRPYLQKYGKIKMGDMVCLFEGQLTRKQIRIIVEKLLEQKILKSEGERKGAYYTIAPDYSKRIKIMEEAVKRGLDVLLKEQTDQS